MTEFLVSTGAMSALMCLLLAVFLLGSSGRLTRSNRYLAGFLILTGIDLVGLVGLILPVSVADGLAYRVPLAFFQMPFFYAYIVTVCLPRRQLKTHFAVALAVWAVIMTDMILRTGGQFPLWAEVALQVQFYGYLALSALALVRFQRALKHSRSASQSMQLRWLWSVIAVSFTAHALVLVRLIAAWQAWPVSWSALQLANGLLALGILCGLTLTALLRPDLFQALDPEEAAPPRSTLRPDAQEVLAKRLRQYLATHRPHLEPELTLRALARRLGVGERDLSHVLNHHLGQHFFDFINAARIAHAMQLIREDGARLKTLIDIAYASGFNSKSSFNTAFKKHAGQTPSAFRSAQNPD